VAYSIAGLVGFWPALIVAPLVVGALGALFERYCLRRVHKFGHVPELLITFGLSYVVLELVQIVWGRTPLAFDPPALLQGPAFTVVQGADGLSLAAGAASDAVCQAAKCSRFPMTRAFMMFVALAMLVGLWLLLTRTRIGLVIQASLTHPEMVEALGHNVPRVFMLVFGSGCALAGLAGVIGGVTFVTEPAMAAVVGSIIFVVVVVGGMGSLAGAFVASVGLGVIESFAVGSDHSIADGLSALGLAMTPETFGFAVWSVKLSQVAAILPYLLLVLILIFRPKGLFGTREG
jgi:branched-chain amino acid transport system permease protein